MKLLLAVIDRWWDNRFHPMARVGFDRIVEGWRRGRVPDMTLGFGMLLLGMSRQRPRRRLYRRQLVAGDAIRVRVVERGKVVGEVEIPAMDT